MSDWLLGTLLAAIPLCAAIGLLFHAYTMASAAEFRAAREAIDRRAADAIAAAHRAVPVSRRYRVTDGNLTLTLEPAADGGYRVTSPADLGLVIRAETLEKAFETVYAAGPTGLG